MEQQPASAEVLPAPLPPLPPLVAPTVQAAPAESASDEEMMRSMLSLDLYMTPTSAESSEDEVPVPTLRPDDSPVEGSPTDSSMSGPPYDPFGYFARLDAGDATVGESPPPPPGAMPLQGRSTIPEWDQWRFDEPFHIDEPTAATISKEAHIDEPTVATSSKEATSSTWATSWTGATSSGATSSGATSSTANAGPSAGVAKASKGVAKARREQKKERFNQVALLLL